MTQTILFVFYSQQLLRTGHRSVIKKIPPLGSGIMRLGRVHWASRRRNLAEINVTLTALALRSIFRASLEVFENGRLCAFCTPVPEWRICWGWTRAKLNREIKSTC
jgi:hypothetical protein